MSDNWPSDLTQLKETLLVRERREALQDDIEQEFIGRLPTEKLKNVFSDPPRGSSGEAVVTAFRQTISDVLTMVGTAFLRNSEEAEERVEVKELDDNLRQDPDYDQDFREPIVR